MALPAPRPWPVRKGPVKGDPALRDAREQGRIVHGGFEHGLDEAVAARLRSGDRTGIAPQIGKVAGKPVDAGAIAVHGRIVRSRCLLERHIDLGLSLCDSLRSAIPCEPVLA
jgi:hypothetical protein